MDSWCATINGTPTYLNDSTFMKNVKISVHLNDTETTTARATNVIVDNE